MPNYKYNTQELWTALTLPVSNFLLHGFSRAGCKTALWIPALKTFFDAGVVEDGEVDRVFITHSHADHSFAAPYLHSRHHKQNFYLPKDTTPLMGKYLESAQTLNDHSDDNSHVQGYELHGVEPGDIIPFSVGNRKFETAVFRCLHTVPCVAYGISEIRRKLKPEFVGREKEIKELRQQGVEVQCDCHVPQFIFMGDTTEKVFEENPTVLTDYPVVIIECTILSDNEGNQEDTANKGHVHWARLKPIVESHPNTTFVLIHFSCRYSDAEIVQFFENEKVVNVVALVPGGPDLYAKLNPKPQGKDKKGK